MNHHPFFTRRHPIPIAHRGGAALWPENTLPAFRGAVSLGFEYVEVDVRATRDGVLVALHDPILDRTTDASGPVAARTWEEVARVDAGHRFGAGAGFPWRGRGVGIPRLEEVVAGLPDTCFVLELKQDGIEQLMADLIRRHRLEDRVLVGSFKDRRLRRLRRLVPGVPTSAGEREAFRVWVASRTGLALRSPADAFQVPVRFRGIPVVDRRLVGAAHASGRQVHVWTVDDPAEMRRLLELGVDGLITDRPDLLLQVLGERPPAGEESR